MDRHPINPLMPAEMTPSMLVRRATTTMGNQVEVDSSAINGRWWEADGRRRARVSQPAFDQCPISRSVPVRRASHRAIKAPMAVSTTIGEMQHLSQPQMVGWAAQAMSESLSLPSDKSVRLEVERPGGTPARRNQGRRGPGVTEARQVMSPSCLSTSQTSPSSPARPTTSGPSWLAAGSTWSGSARPTSTEPIATRRQRNSSRLAGSSPSLRLDPPKVRMGARVGS